MSPSAKPEQPRILVVDDEENIRLLARRFLEQAGYAVTEASNGQEAIELLGRGPLPDLLMADLNMPGIRGEDMVQRVRAVEPDLKVLYVTGNIDQLMDKRPVLWEGEAFLDKPFQKAGLLEAVSLLLYGTLKKPGT